MAEYLEEVRHVAGGYWNAVHALTGAYFLSFHVDSGSQPRRPRYLHTRASENQIALAGTGPEVEDSGPDSQANAKAQSKLKRQGVTVLHRSRVATRRATAPVRRWQARRLKCRVGRRL